MLKYTFEEIKEMSSVTEDMVEQYIEESEVVHKDVEVRDKMCTTTYLYGPNKFIFSGTSCSLSKGNYEKSIGIEMNMEDIKNKIWKHLAFYILAIKENN